MHAYVLCVTVYALIHKQMSILTFEGLSRTFKASTNVYFCQVIITSKIILQLLGTHVNEVCRSSLEI